MNGATASGPALRGRRIVDAIKAGGIEFVVAVPDITTSDGLLWPIARDRDLTLIRVCKEDEGVSICAALSYTGRRALLLIQNTGLFDSVNAIRAIAVEYRNPVCMMVGLQGIEPGVVPAQSAKYSVRLAEPLLDLLGVDRHLIRIDSHVSRIAPAIDAAYETSRPVCLVIGGVPVPEERP
jgi:sulfopyruvate decarboxylase subunit alpha